MYRRWRFAHFHPSVDISTNTVNICIVHVDTAQQATTLTYRMGLASVAWSKAI